MPDLQFKGKEFVYNHHLSVPYRPLVPDIAKSILGKDQAPRLDGNLIIQGDNLHALKALMPMYAGKIDCIYIDPPYNTKNETWRYNDNVNSPMIREWIESNPVNGEDMLRHDKWLCLMYPRLRLLKELLSEKGVMLISIDDNELRNLLLSLEEIFGENNWVGTIVWKNVTDNNPTNVSIEHEYIVCIAKNKELINKFWKSSISDVKDVLVNIGDQLISQYSDADELQTAYTKWFKEHKQELWPLDRYKYIDRGGVYTGSQSVHNPGREGYRYDVLHDKTGKPCKEPLMGYRFPQETMQKLIEQNKILYGDDHNKIIELKVYASEYEDKLPSVIQLDGRMGSYELKEIFPEKTKVFDTPKCTQLLLQLLSFVTHKNSIVLDSFAGSGTTAQAVLQMNQVDGGKRKFILVECEDYADELTAERVRRVINGVPKSKLDDLRNGLGGEFVYSILGDPIDIERLLSGAGLPDFEQLGGWLFNTATSEAFDPSKASTKDFYLGESENYYVWLYYKPDLDYLKSREAALTLQRAEELANKLPFSKTSKRHLIFAPAKFAPNKALHALGIEYAPLPFSLFRIDR
jgi:adenine-specific DNA-methyltransferase